MKKKAVTAILFLSVPLLTAVSCFLFLSNVVSVNLPEPPLDCATLGTPPTATLWHIPDYPAIDRMRENVINTLEQCEVSFQGSEGRVSGLLPAPEYGMIYVRDMSTMMPALQYFYGDEYMRTPIEEFLSRQYGPRTRSLDGDLPGAGAISAVLAPYGGVDKATVVSDEEAHLLHAAYLYYRAFGGVEWLQKPLEGEPIISRLNRALDWLYAHRLDPDCQLIERGHTTDWGDIKPEPSLDPTDLDPATDLLTASSYDQALVCRTLLELAEMNEALGAESRARDLEERALGLRLSMNANLWNSEGGFYIIHRHLSALPHPFPEEKMIAIGNAFVAYVKLAEPRQAEQLLAALERARLAASAGKPGVSLYPPYPEGFFAHPQMSPGEYQNGGLWDWWGGVLITAEFDNGCSLLARAHLRMVAEEWTHHPGQVFEWQVASTNEGQGAANYASAAATMAEAVVRGLFGVTIEKDAIQLRPRLGKHEGQVRVIQPASGLYASYDYRYAPECALLDYGSNHPDALEIALLLPAGRGIEKVSIDGLTVPYRLETELWDSYCVLRGPSGVHRVVFTLKPA